MVVLPQPLLLLKSQHYSFSIGSRFVVFLHVYFLLPQTKPTTPLTLWALGQFARSREPEREADSSPPFDSEVTFSSNLIPPSVSVIYLGTGYLTRLRLKTFMVQDSINHSPTLGHVVLGTSADHPVNSRVDHEFAGEIELISPPNTRVFPFEICTQRSISILHFGSAYTSNRITKLMKFKETVWCE